jgi:hypothetical protein
MVLVLIVINHLHTWNGNLETRLNHSCLKIEHLILTLKDGLAYQVIFPSKNPVIDVKTAELLLVNAHEVISLENNTWVDFPGF